jgi:hypothetical protein
LYFVKLSSLLQTASLRLELWETKKRSGETIKTREGYIFTSLGIDVVPAFRVSNLLDQYFLIPKGGNGTGWLKTNPIKDKNVVNKLHNLHYNTFRGLVKLAKLWNQHCNDNRLRSYHIEAIAINLVKNRSPPLSH